MQKLALIQFIQQRSQATSKEIMEIAQLFEAKSIEKGENFLQAGTVSDTYLFMETGFMRAFTFDYDGNEVTTNFYRANSLVFEPASFFTRIPSKETIQALTHCSGYCISFEQLNNLFHSMPAFREFGRAVLVNGFAALKQRTLSLINETAETRYQLLLQHNSDIFQHAQLKQIASYLGITDTSLSRIRREYAKK
jgi:CRP-like cAMP-binding protein